MALPNGAIRCWSALGSKIIILVFGKTGQVATELQLLREVKALSRTDADLSDPQGCANAIQHYSPRAVINAAAYTAVDAAEDEEHIANIINGEAPTAMANACSTLGIPLVHISTDYVFEGTGETAWSPSDPTSPKNAYGRSKLVGEAGIRQSSAIYAILRTSWVVSAHGTNFVKTMLRLSETQDELNVVADQIGGPTPASAIAAACVQIAEQLILDPSKSGTYNFSGAPDVSWAEFAAEIFEQAGKLVVVKPILTADYPKRAQRPLNSRMVCSAMEQVFRIKRPDWREGLKMILRDLRVSS